MKKTHNIGSHFIWKIATNTFFTPSLKYASRTIVISSWFEYTILQRRSTFNKYL